MFCACAAKARARAARAAQARAIEKVIGVSGAAAGAARCAQILQRATAPGPCGFLPVRARRRGAGRRPSPRTRHADEDRSGVPFRRKRGSAADSFERARASSRGHACRIVPAALRHARTFGSTLRQAPLHRRPRRPPRGDGGRRRADERDRLPALRETDGGGDGRLSARASSPRSSAAPIPRSSTRSRAASSRRTEPSAARMARAPASSRWRCCATSSVSAVPPAEKRSPRRRDAVKGRSRPAPRCRRDDRRVVDADDQASALRWPSSTSRNLRKSTGFVR